MDNEPGKKEKHVDDEKYVHSKQDSARLFTDKKRKEKEAEEDAVGGF